MNQMIDPSWCQRSLSTKIAFAVLGVHALRRAIRHADPGAVDFRRRANRD
jgi:hypothetical protein